MKADLGLGILAVEEFVAIHPVATLEVTLSWIAQGSTSLGCAPAPMEESLHR